MRSFANSFSSFGLVRSRTVLVETTDPPLQAHIFSPGGVISKAASFKDLVGAEMGQDKERINKSKHEF